MRAVDSLLEEHGGDHRKHPRETRGASSVTHRPNVKQ
jgi:hypothetical protein